jgi:hypothetical protein
MALAQVIMQEAKVDREAVADHVIVPQSHMEGAHPLTLSLQDRSFTRLENPAAWALELPL